MQETQAQSLGWEDSLEKERATLFSILAEGQRSLTGYSPQCGQESDMTEQLSAHTQAGIPDEKYWFLTC